MSNEIFSYEDPFSGCGIDRLETASIQTESERAPPEAENVQITADAPNTESDSDDDHYSYSSVDTSSDVHSQNRPSGNSPNFLSRAVNSVVNLASSFFVRPTKDDSNQKSNPFETESSKTNSESDQRNIERAQPKQQLAQGLDQSLEVNIAQERTQSEKATLTVRIFTAHPLFDHTSIELNLGNGDIQYLSVFPEDSPADSKNESQDVDLPDLFSDVPRTKTNHIVSANLVLKTDPNDDDERNRSYGSIKIPLDETEAQQVEEYFKLVKQKTNDGELHFSLMPGLHSDGSHIHCAMVVKGALDRISSIEKHNGFVRSVVAQTVITTPTHEFYRAQALAQGQGQDFQQPTTQTHPDFSPQATHTRLFGIFSESSATSERPAIALCENASAPVNTSTPKRQR